MGTIRSIPLKKFVAFSSSAIMRPMVFPTSGWLWYFSSNKMRLGGGGCEESVGCNGKKKFLSRWEPVPKICGRCRFLQTRRSGHVGGRPDIVHRAPLHPATCACGNKGNTGERKSPKGLGGTARDYVKSSSSTCKQRVMAFISNPRLRPKRMSFPLRS